MAIHHVNVKPETIATLLEAAEQARMTLLDFEGWVLDDWARLYELEKARRFTQQEVTNAIPKRG